MIINIENGITRMPIWRMNEPVNFQLDDSEHIAIVGNNASGKSLLCDIITGKHPLLGKDVEYDFSPMQSVLASDCIKYITFRDTYGGDNDRTYYLQQRWNQTEIDDSTPTVSQLLDKAYQLSGADTEEHNNLRKHLYDIFNLHYILDKYIILLSSGELRKFILCKTLLSNPRVLIMDNPFIGLDKETRQQLRETLELLGKERYLQIILVLTKDEDIPHFVTHVVPVRNKIVYPKIKKEEYFTSQNRISSISPNNVLLPSSAYVKTNTPSDVIVDMNNVSIRYGERTILKNLNWKIKNGEKWSLSGPNGAGKSTLLSLVCADNPQSYACDFTLFDKKRGHGESIWDIKKHIGYVSPEMHRAYNKDMQSIRIVASGLKDSVGLYVKPTEKDYSECYEWMKTFSITHLADRSFLTLSSGEQRLILLARAFVKNPDLLILDEPLHGLDKKNSEMVKDIISAYCSLENKTLIMVTHYVENLPSCITHHLELKRNI